MIYLGSDHGGFQLKEIIKIWLTDQKLEFQDMGASENNPDDDYPEFAVKVSEMVAKNPLNLGILICRSATGMVIVANKIKGVRACAVYNTHEASYVREVNHANVIGLSGDWTSESDAKEIILAFLNAQPSQEERHVRRIEQIKRLELSV